MNDNEQVKKMIKKVEEIEKAQHRDRYDTDKKYRNNVVNLILGELGKVVEDENK